MTPPPIGVVVLISGRGSNLQAIIDEAGRAHAPFAVRAVISNNPGAQGLERAERAGIPTHVLRHQEFPDREAFDRALMAQIDRYAPRLVALAGFMRILTPAFVEHYAGRLMNVHPALLPAFPGLDTHARALAAGAKTHGATVHFVTRDVDAGPAVIQARVPVHPGDAAERLAARVLEQEHRIYPLAIRWFAEGRLTVENGRVLLDGAVRPEQGLAAPAGRTPDPPPPARRRS